MVYLGKLYFLFTRTTCIWKCAQMIWIVENQALHYLVIFGFPKPKFGILFGAIVNREPRSNFISLEVSFVSRSSSCSNHYMPSVMYLPLKYT